jgi:hypothetical protein
MTIKNNNKKTYDKTKQKVVICHKLTNDEGAQMLMCERNKKP